MIKTLTLKELKDRIKEMEAHGLVTDTSPVILETHPDETISSLVGILHNEVITKGTQYSVLVLSSKARR